jgi:hypothetical protein
MAITPGTLVRRLRRFNRGAVVREVRAEIDKPLPIIRARVKASALGKLPKRGGLAAWAAAAHLTAQVSVSGNTVTAAIKVHRTSLYKASDLRALDRGRVRHPAWGRRSPGSWSVQMVTPRVYSEPIEGSPEWRAAVERACGDAVGVIEHG